MRRRANESTKQYLQEDAGVGVERHGDLACRRAVRELQLASQISKREKEKTRKRG
jgi:hypothetical protein